MVDPQLWTGKVENVEINREYVLDFEMDAKVIPPEEDAELAEAQQH